MSTSIQGVSAGGGWPQAGAPRGPEGERQGPAAPHRALLVAAGSLAAPGLVAVILGAVGALTGKTPPELGSLHARQRLPGTDSPLPAAKAAPRPDVRAAA